MRTKKFFRVLVAAALAVVSISAFAQYSSVPTAGGAGGYDATGTSDYVTVGSRMPYYVDPDNAIEALIAGGNMDTSQFMWEVLSLPGLVNQWGATTPEQADNTPLVAGGAAGYYTANEISVNWNVAANARYVVRATEHSMPISGVFAEGCDDPTAQADTVYVIDRPTIVFPTTFYNAACGTTPGAATSFYVPINVTGLATWRITFSVTYNGAGYVPSGEVVGFGALEGSTDADVLANAASVKNLAGTPTAGTAGLNVVLNGGGATNGYGRYVVNVTNITDRISRKSQDVIASQAGDLPASDYTIYVMPTPATGTIQHRINLGW
jgi:hypothetical protein